MVMAFSINLYLISFEIFLHNTLDGYGYTEFLINFARGFVRRGLIGEWLLWFTSATGIHPHDTINAICLTAFVLVLWFFFREFHKGGYNWWLILSPVFCGFVVYIIRKDFLLYGIVIGIFYFMRNTSPTVWKRAIAFLLATFGLFLHEAFIFWGLPVYAMILLTERKHRVINSLQVTLLLGVFTVMCYYKGDLDTAHAIIDSWNAIIDGSPLYFIEKDSIGALSWDTKSTIINHIARNIGSTRFGIVYWPICILVVYYFLTFFFNSFKPTKATYGMTEQTHLSSLLLTLYLCMLPMFAMLSCDYGRLIQYVTVTAFSAYFLIDKDVIDRMLPKKLQRFVAGLNTTLYRLLPQSKGLITVLLLIIGISPYWYNPTEAMMKSPLGTIGYFCCIKILKLLGI